MLGSGSRVVVIVWFQLRLAGCPTNARARIGCSQKQGKVWLRSPVRLRQLDGWPISLVPCFAQLTLDSSRGAVKSAKRIFLDLPEQDLAPITPTLKVEGGFSTVADRENHLCFALSNDVIPIAYIDG